MEALLERGAVVAAIRETNARRETPLWLVSNGGGKGRAKGASRGERSNGSKQADDGKQGDGGNRMRELLIAVGAGEPLEDEMPNDETPNDETPNDETPNGETPTVSKAETGSIYETIAELVDGPERPGERRPVRACLFPTSPPRRPLPSPGQSLPTDDRDAEIGASASASIPPRSTTTDGTPTLTLLPTLIQPAMGHKSSRRRSESGHVWTFWRWLDAAMLAAIVGMFALEAQRKSEPSVPVPGGFGFFPVRVHDF